MRCGSGSINRRRTSRVGRVARAHRARMDHPTIYAVRSSPASPVSRKALREVCRSPNVGGKMSYI